MYVNRKEIAEIERDKGLLASRIGVEMPAADEALGNKALLGFSRRGGSGDRTLANIASSIYWVLHLDRPFPIEWLISHVHCNLESIPSSTTADF